MHELNEVRRENNGAYGGLIITSFLPALSKSLNFNNKIMRPSSLYFILKLYSLLVLLTGQI